MAKTRITSILLPSGWLSISGCTSDGSLWICPTPEGRVLYAKEEHVLAWKTVPQKEEPRGFDLEVA